jgi:hypothetical protein
MSKLYLAYGSNCNRAQMTRRCPTGVFVGLADLIDYRLAFRGVADVEPHKGSTVRCAMWTIEKNDELALDQYEGVSSGFYEKLYAEIVLRGRKQPALFYAMRGPRPGVPRRDQHEPPAGYEEACRAGYRDCGIDQSQIDAARKRAAGSKNRKQTYFGKWSPKPKSETINEEPDWFLARHHQPALF